MSRDQQKFLIGTSGWSYSHWRGTFYPKDLPQKKWFNYYITKFSTVEINATFYRAFNEATYQKWYDMAPKGFKYVLKTHRIITHRRFLKNVEAEIKRCWNSALLLKEKLGTMLLQLSPQTAYDPDRLKKALTAFPQRNKIAVEFRHEKWLTQEIKSMLAKLEVTFCTADSPSIDLINWLTAKTAYIRLHGSAEMYSGCYSNAELKKIASLAKNMLHQGANQVYIFFNNDTQGFAPRNALELKGLLL